MENILADIKNHQNIKYNNDIDRYLRQISPTYNAIFKLNFILDKLIINEQMFITDDLSEDVTQIENILYNGDKQYTLSRKFKYWYKLMNRFLKRIKDVAE